MLLSTSIAAMRQPVSAGTTRPRAWRLEQLERLEQAIAARPLADFDLEWGKSFVYVQLWGEYESPSRQLR